MKILFDHSTPAPLVGLLRGHEVALAITLGWQRLRNGDLLTVAERAYFDILVSCDQSIPYQ